MHLDLHMEGRDEAATESGGQGGMIPQSMAASYITSLIIIFLILGGLILFGRKLRGMPWARGKLPQSLIQITAMRGLGAQNSLAIAEVEGQRFLIALGRSGVTCIGRLDTPADPASSAQEPS